MKFKGIITSFSFLLLLGSSLLALFNILSGARHTGVLRNFYWLEADTSGFNDAPGNTRWYNYNWCEFSDGRTGRCSNRKVPVAFSPKDNFGYTEEMPNTFLQKRNTYYWLSRFAWVTLLLALIFMLSALLPHILAIFTERAHVISTFPLWFALFFLTLSACLYTACYVKGRNAFHRRNRYAKLGKRNFWFIWVSVFLLGLNCLWSTFLAASRAVTLYKNRSHKSDTYYDHPSDRSFDNSTAVHSGASAPQRKTFFNKDTGRPKGSNYDGEVLADSRDAGYSGNHNTYGADRTPHVSAPKTAAGYTGSAAQPNSAYATQPTSNYTPSTPAAAYRGNEVNTPSAKVSSPTKPTYDADKDFKAVNYDAYNSQSTTAPKQAPYPAGSETYRGGDNNGYYTPVNRNSGRIVDPTEYQGKPGTGHDLGVMAAQTASNAAKAI
ncbi:uncharacterized protein Ecym_6439 [Eremothecium cymbalariae DBVPG|uniref:SUR7 family protein FMP45 n=1 Tax=Eremothecium cymbalariae (strain CBS 270.75 / DBVPG 7215 / KCTC 17166 / NRRL Y-17582) TaxID=931890 RepID=G8JUN0_ERECY|nr:hypothetical protein Ecym_6439 [Eremothecium cymbalariae DBVPG\